MVGVSLTVELVLMRWNVEAWLLTAHLPRRRVARAFLAKVLEIARADVATIPLAGDSAAGIAHRTAARHAALAILEEYIPRYLARLPPV